MNVKHYDVVSSAAVEHFAASSTTVVKKIMYLYIY